MSRESPEEKLEKYKDIPKERLDKITKTKTLGTGAYSTVHSLNKKTVAKVITKVKGKGSGKLEAKIHEKLQELTEDYITPAIPLLFQKDFTADRDILVIEKCDTTLWRYTTETIGMSSKKRINYFKSIILQTFLALAILQKRYPGFRHNDLKIDNILLDLSPHPAFVQKFMGRYYRIPKDYPVVKIADFDYTNIPEKIANPKVKTAFSKSFGCTPERSDIYDIHVFLNSLYSKNKVIPDSIVKWIETIIPKKYLDKDNEWVKHGRLINPKSVKIKTVRSLIKDEFFDQFSVEASSLSDSMDIWG